MPMKQGFLRVACLESQPLRQDWQSLQVRRTVAVSQRSAPARSPALLAQEIEHRCLRQHSFGNAVALGTGALLGGLRCLQISPEMARTLDDALSDREPHPLEALQRRCD